MTNTSHKIVFFGNERLVSGLKQTNAPILQGLIDHGYTVAAVISHHTDGHSRSNRPLEVAEIAQTHGIPVLLPTRLADIQAQIEAYEADAAILVAYGRLIPQSIIDIFPRGIINIHPSLLPKFRGPTPIESVIAQSETKTGVSLMQLTAGMDEGPVYAQTEVALHGTETKFDLYKTLARISTDLLFDTLPAILDGSLTPKPQDNSRASYCQLLQKTDAWLQPDQQTASEAERLVRAHLGFPKSKLTIADQDIIVLAAHVTDHQKTPLDVAFVGGAFLAIDQLIAPSGKTMTAEAFLRGYTLA